MTADELVTDLELQSSQMEYGYAVSDWKLLSDAATMLREQQTEIEALYNLVAEQDKKIIDLAFKLAYAERGNEVVKEAKYGITTKWDGITTYHETNESIGKTQEK